MAKSSNQLPSQFSEYQKYVDYWAKPRESERNRARRHASMDEINGFYNAMLPRLGEIIEYLNGFPLDGMPDDAKTLMRLSLALMEIAPAVELYRQPDVPDAFDMERMEIVLDKAEFV